MKKRLSVLAVLLIAVLAAGLLSGCGASSMSGAAADQAMSMPAEAPAPEAPSMDSGSSYSNYTSTYEVEKAEAMVESQTASDLSTKIIYSSTARIETLEFDQTVSDVYSMLREYGAFIEYSSIQGVDYYSGFYNEENSRYASYTIRVPVEKYSAMTGALDTLGNVTYLSSSADNVTSAYYDSESRLNTYRTEEERLLAMLEKAEDVEVMIAIETRLSEVRYQIENLTTQLKVWDNQVSYSTIDLEICEVFELTREPETPEVQLTYAQRMGRAFKNSAEDIWEFLQEFVIFFVGALPFILIVAVIVVVVLIIARRNSKRRKDEIAQRMSDSRAADEAGKKED